MAYVIYAIGSAIYPDQEKESKLGFWCYYLRTHDHSELQCNSVEEKTTASRMQLTAILEALKACKDIGPQNTVKIYTTNQQYFKLCFDKPNSRKKNLDLWKEIDKLQVKKELMAFPADLDNNVKASRAMTILKTALEDSKEHNSLWQASKNNPNMNKFFEV